MTLILILLKRLLLYSGLLIFCLAQANQPRTTVTDDLASVKQLWAVIDSDIVAIESVAEEGQLRRVHYYTNTLRIAIKSLPSFSSMLTQNQLAQVKENVKLAEGIVDTIDGAGHAHDTALTIQSLATLQSVLREMRANYSNVQEESDTMQNTLALD